jgi:hypothetical protein
LPQHASSLDYLSDTSSHQQFTTGLMNLSRLALAPEDPVRKGEFRATARMGSPEKI